MLHSFRRSENVCTAQQVQQDYSSKCPAYDQEHRLVSGVLEYQGLSYEHYGYPGRHKQSDAGWFFSESRLRGHRCDARAASVSGDDPWLISDYTFALEGHPRADFNVRRRLIRVVHRGTQYAGQEEEPVDIPLGVSYDLRAELVSEDVEWRSTSLPRPRIDGPQIATVVGPVGEETHYDEWGQVKIQLPWDRKEYHNELSACWMRVVQNRVGADWGHAATLWIGQEMIVDCPDGDYDQSIIAGYIYRTTNRSPYVLPNYKILSATKNKEYKGNRANELRIDDTTAQISAALMSDYDVSALRLGYLTHPWSEGGRPRDEGFELRTDEYGATRTTKGLLLSAEGQFRVGTGCLDRDVVVQALEVVLELARELGDYAGEHQGVGHNAVPQ